MLLEWLRRHDAALDAHLHTYLFSDGPITALEAAQKTATPASVPVADGSLGVGHVRGGA